MRQTKEKSWEKKSPAPHNVSLQAESFQYKSLHSVIQRLGPRYKYTIFLSASCSHSILSKKIQCAIHVLISEK